MILLSWWTRTGLYLIGLFILLEIVLLGLTYSVVLVCRGVLHFARRLLRRSGRRARVARSEDARDRRGF